MGVFQFGERLPDFGKAMGHEEKWKPHNNCK